MIFHHRGLECQSRKSRETWKNRKFSLGVQSEARQRLTVLPTHWSSQTPSSNNIRDNSTHRHHQLVHTKIRLIIFFAVKDGEALYSQQKQDQELTVAQITNSLLPNSDLN